MSQTTVGFAGMNGAEEAELRTLFEQANARSGRAFAEADQASADVLVIDVDSIHGHMTWLQTQSDPDRRIIALSTRDTPHSDFCIVKPASLEDMVQALEAMAGSTGATEPEPDEHAERIAGAADAVDPADPAVEPVEADDAQAMPPPPPEPRPVSTVMVDGDAEAGLDDAHAAATPTPPAPPRPPRLADYLVPGALPGPSRLAFEGAPQLAVDPDTQTYLGPTQLKGFQRYAGAERIDPSDWEPMDAGELARLREQIGAPQPWSRLSWLAGLYGSPGRLADGHSSGDRFELVRWPQIEREFPRHFRIATTMMKGPATAAEIAEAAGSPPEEVIDFINASLATGQARAVQPEPEPEAEPSSRGLLGRLKSLRGN